MPSLQALSNIFLTNVLLLFVPVCIVLAATLSAPAKIKAAEIDIVREEIDDVGCLKDIGCESMHEEDAIGTGTWFAFDEYCVQRFLVLIVSGDVFDGSMPVFHDLISYR